MRTLAKGSLVAALVAVALALPPNSAIVLAQEKTTSGANDVRVGDRVYLSVDGEKALTDSFTVVAGPALELPVIGTVSLAGVRRADLEPYLTKAIGRFIKNPVVRVKLRSQVRLTVVGQVGKPGFIDLPPEAPLADAITKAGGPTADAKLDKMEISRGGATLIKGGALRKALDGGTTLAQLSLQSGDELSIGRGGAFPRTLSIMATVVGSIGSLYYLYVVTRR
jgi:protein involved in polysaccharide export with SLBB domain